MDREKILSMDPYILLSWMNMKLRDEFSSLIYLCEDYNVDSLEIICKLKLIGYVYNKYRNQFVSEETL